MAILQQEESSSVLVAWTQLTSSVEVGPDYELNIGGDSDSPLRTEALARLFVIDRAIVRSESLGTIVSQGYQSIGDALMLLATEDPDTCCAALETLETIVQKASSNAPKKPVSLLMAHVHRVVLNATDSEVISKAQHVLAEALSGGSSRRAEFFSLLTDSQLLETLAKLENECLSGPPSNMQSALHLLGFFLEHTHHALPTSRETVLAAATRYIRLLRMTLIDTNPFDTRFAAAQSICALHDLWTARTPSSQPSPIVLGLGLILYDMLQDDDDEIRDHAALATHTFLTLTTPQCPPSHTVPILTTHTLLTHLPRFFPTSPALTTHALRRLTHTPPPTPLFTPPFSTHLAAATREQTALFAHEPQNLFKDDVLDALAWTAVLTSPSLRTALPQAVVQRAAAWTSEALEALVRRFEVDGGAAGWARRGEVLGWIVRVVGVAEVVVRATSGSAGASGSGGVKLGLRRLADAMVVWEGRGVVVQRVEKVLQEDVLRGLGVLKGVAGLAPGYGEVWL